MDDILFDSFEAPLPAPRKTDLVDALNQLRSVLCSGGDGKHTPYLTARKAVIYPLLERLTTLVSSLPEEGPSTCSKCPLWMAREDVRVAISTADRLMENPNCGVTHDEAENLRDLILRAYWHKA